MSVAPNFQGAPQTQRIPRRFCLVERWLWFAMMCVAMVLLGCKSGPSNETARLKESVDFAVKVLQRIDSDPARKLMFEDIAQTGGSLLTVITAEAPDTNTLLPFRLDSPPSQWSVVVRQDEEDPTIVWIEGYGENLSEPTISKSVQVKAIETL